jgi:hypothetical protein
MRRRIGLGVSLAVAGWAQAPGDAHVDAYRRWREADAALEREGPWGPRAAGAAQAVAAWGEARSAYLSRVAQETVQALTALEKSGPGAPHDVAPAAALQALVKAGVGRVTGEIAVYAGDSDRGIQPLRQALERERAALTALNTAISNRGLAFAQYAESLSALETARRRAAELYRDRLAPAVTGAGEQAGHEAAAWAKYYDALAAAPAAPRTATGAEPAKREAPRTAPTPEGAPATTTVPPVPASRYVGEWVYPLAGGLYHGAVPASAQLVVAERDGQLRGALGVTFWLPEGSTGDPDLRFTFAGEFKPVRNQVLPLETREGAKGTLELIPGGAINLIEVNFQTEQRPGKVRLGNFVLIRK